MMGRGVVRVSDGSDAHGEKAAAREPDHKLRSDWFDRLKISIIADIRKYKLGNQMVE